MFITNGPYAAIDSFKGSPETINTTLFFDAVIENVSPSYANSNKWSAFTSIDSFI